VAPSPARRPAVTGQVYTNHRDPGAPTPGDVVVVVIDGAPSTSYAQDQGQVGLVSRLVRHRPMRQHRWYLEDLEPVHAVRRPNLLSQGGLGGQP
jgi:hypothetical protein